PRAEVFVSQAYAWDTLNPNLKHCEKMIEKSKK
ncbi:aldehyde-activating protein, partial [Acinetobacter geminorum]